MFGLWKKKQTPKLINEPDAVYMHRSTADGVLVRAAKESERPVIITSFFPASLTRMEEALNAAGLGARPLATGGWPSYSMLDGAPWLLSARIIAADLGFDTWLSRSNRELSFLFVEHYPLLSAESAVLDILEKVSANRPQRTLFFVGLDEPLLCTFGGERIIGLMQVLGMQPDDRISHPMVNKALIKARAKLQKRLAHTVPADSDVEWFQRNLIGR